MNHHLQADPLLRYDEGGAIRGRSAGGLTARLATTAEVLRQAWAIRHAGYSSRGFIDRAPDALFFDEWDHFSSTKTVVLYKNGSPAATARVCLYAPGSGIAGSEATPAMEIFRSEIVSTFERIYGFSRAAEVMRLARHPDFGTDCELVFALFQMVGCLLIDLEVDAAICAVRKHHTPFYRRMGFHTVAEPRRYPKLKFETALMACVRSGGREVRDYLPGLRSISREDLSYQDFVAGREVPVFATAQSGQELSEVFTARFEAIRRGQTRSH